jgi:purine-binding chemotaxis protein CheW
MSAMAKTAQSGKAKASAARVEMCSVRVGGRIFGVSINKVIEILGGARPQPVPLAPAFIGGLVHYRGDVLTAVSLRQLLDLPPQEGAQDILVLESPGGSFGLLVDKVSEVLTVDASAYEPNPSIVDEKRRTLFGGAYKLANQLMVMLDPEQLEPMRLAGKA